MSGGQWEDPFIFNRLILCRSKSKGDKGGFGMNLIEIIRYASEKKATDLHLSPGQPLFLRVNTDLVKTQFTMTDRMTKSFAEHLLNDEDIDELYNEGSVDLSLNLGALHCRVNVFLSDAGVGFAIRLLLKSSIRLADANLHPNMKELINKGPGLVLVTGPTGSGKSTTLVALLEEINATQSQNIITLESPIEYRIDPKKSIIRQRQIGIHTQSFEKGLVDALREDPDVLVVGEMRDQESMKKTLVAAESGHLVLATLHSSNAIDAVYRLMMSFQGEQQSFILSQIADTLIGIVSQRMHFVKGLNLLVPCCEIMFANHAIRNVIRKGEVSKLSSLIQTGAGEGMLTFERYQAWLDERNDWSVKPRTSTEFGSTDLIELKAQRNKIKSGVKNERRSEADKKTITETTTSREVAFRPEENIKNDFSAKADEKLGTTEIYNIEDEVEQKQKMLAEKLGLQDLPNHRLTRPAQRSPGLRHKHLVGDAEAAAPKKTPFTSADQTKVHKDGRIEIPEIEVDLKEIVKAYEDKN